MALQRRIGAVREGGVNTELPHYRVLIESALAYASGTHTFEDVAQEVEDGRAQFWPGPHSVIITQIDEEPQGHTLHFFLAAGTSAELRAMEPGILEWGRGQGCVRARLVGRKGWERSFLKDTGWVNSGLIIMEKSINGPSREVRKAE